jgi:hypothetical protein
MLNAWLEMPERAHWRPTITTVGLEERAFGSRPNLKSQGQLFAELRAKNYGSEAAAREELHAIAQRWGGAVGTLKAGTQPQFDSTGKVIEKKPENPNRNPWVAAEGQKEWTPEQRRRQTETARTDLALAQRQARAANSFVGSPRPNAKSLISRF